MNLSELLCPLLIIGSYFLGSVSSAILVMYLSIGFVITQLADLMNAMDWNVVHIHVILLVWFGYFLVDNPKTEIQRSPA